MNSVKSTFSIKDLENLSGIKAHTIRIWEKRYNLLQPSRTDTNIRCYDIENLQRLLNVTYLYKNGFKISKISALGHEKISDAVRGLITEQKTNEHILSSFKMAMLNFDQVLFSATYNKLLKEKSFQDLFYQDFIPLLSELGMLWQTNTITPCHEHFISNLIKQKILVNTEKYQSLSPSNTTKTFILFLPDNEIHELGLLFLNYEILRKGYRAIFLGPSIPIEELKDFFSLYNNLVFLSYFTVKPDSDRVNSYLMNFYEELLKDRDAELWILGRMLKQVNTKQLPNKIIPYSRLDQLVRKL